MNPTQASPNTDRSDLEASSIIPAIVDGSIHQDKKRRQRNVLTLILLFLTSVNVYFSATTFVNQNYLTVGKSGYLTFSGSEDRKLKIQSTLASYNGGTLNSDEATPESLNQLSELRFDPETNGGVALKATVWGYVLYPDRFTRPGVGRQELYLATSLGVIHYSGSTYYFLPENDLNAAVYARTAAAAAAFSSSSSSPSSVSVASRKLADASTANDAEANAPSTVPSSPSNERACVSGMTTIAVLNETGFVTYHDFHDDCLDPTLTTADLNRLFEEDAGSSGVPTSRRLDTDTSSSLTLADLHAQQQSSLPFQPTLTGQVDSSVKMVGVSIAPPQVISVVVGEEIYNLTTPANAAVLSDEELAQHVSRMTKMSVDSLTVVNPDSPPHHLRHLMRWKGISRVVHAVEHVVKPIVPIVTAKPSTILKTVLKNGKKTLQRTARALVQREVLITAAGILSGGELFVAVFDLYQAAQAAKQNYQMMQGLTKGRILADSATDLPATVVDLTLSSAAEIQPGGFAKRNDFIFHPVDTPCMTALSYKQRHAMVGNRPVGFVQLSKLLEDGSAIILADDDEVCAEDNILFDTATSHTTVTLSE